MNSSVIPGVVARLHGGDRVVRLGIGPLRDRGEREVGALPALVAVHRVVPARHGRDPVGRKLGEVVHGRGRRDVATVGERVDPGLLRLALAAGELEQRPQVVDVGVDAAVRDEAHQVDIGAAAERRDERLVLEERTACDRAVDAHQVLVEHSSRADREVADLGVAHLAGREPDRLAGGLDRRVRAALPEPVEHRRIGQRDRVPRARRGAAPAVEDHECYEWVGAADRHIAANESGSREAPPTSAPSTPGCDISSAALSGLTEPP